MQGAVLHPARTPRRLPGTLRARYCPDMGERNGFSKWIHVGQIVLGLGFAGSGIAQLLHEQRESQGAVGAPPRQPRGRLLAGRLPGGRQSGKRLEATPGEDGDGRDGLPMPTAETHDVGHIDERVDLIIKLIRDGAADPVIGEKAKILLGRKCDSTGRHVPKGEEGRRSGVKFCVPEKDCTAEVRAIFNAVRDPRSQYAIRYVRDSLIGDVFTAAKRTLLRINGGDCDDYCVTIGALLMSIGHPVYVCVITTTDRQTWNHVYLLTPSKFDDPNAPLIALDASVSKPMGWEAPGAATNRATGKTAGIVKRSKVYPVHKPNEG